MTKTALIVGTGSGISAAFARALAADGYRVALAARKLEKLAGLAGEIGAVTISADATQADSVAQLFAEVDRQLGPLDVALYNASYRARGPFLDLVPQEVARSMEVSAFGAFLVAQQAARRMVARGQGVILFTGASASVKGYAQSAPFAMGKFALRGLAQSMARELGPKGIHVAHVVVDGAIDTEFIRTQFPERYALKEQDGILNPDHIAENYWYLHTQPRDAWTFEMDLRPYMEAW